MTDIEVRQARLADYDAVAAFTQDTWGERNGDYIPYAFEHWVETDGPTQHTLVADAGDDIAGLSQIVLLSDHEAWAQGLRVNPAFRGRGVSHDLAEVLFDWAAGRGATVCRNMVFAWNAAGLGQSRAVGFDPATEFRWIRPTPDPDVDPTLAVGEDPDVAWTAWRRSDAFAHLRGLALDADETWAVSELTREKLRRAAEERRVLTVSDGDGVRGMTFRTRTYERQDEDGEEQTWAEYGVAVWADVPAARSLVAAIARDAASIDADRTRVLIPETARHVSDAAYVRANISDEPDFVLEADLTARR
jgi:GNAT superfamily N-acetyltransferase